MARRNLPLNAAQVGVLTWVQEGCPKGTYEDWAHRIVARALHTRGLVVVTGRGAAWSATLTDDGVHYVKHGIYPEPEEPLGSLLNHSTDSRASSAETKSPPVKMWSARAEAPKKPGQIEQYVALLTDVGNRGIRVPYADERLHRQRAVKARRDGRIPEGMQFSFRRRRGDDEDELWIVLVTFPAWQAAVLAPVRRPKGLEQSDVVRALSESQTFPVTGGPRERALLLLDALVSGAREEGMTVTASTAQLINRRSTAVMGPRRDEIVFTGEAGEAGEVRLWLTQAMMHLPHEPTERELNRARQGYLFPDHEEVPDEHFGIVLDDRPGVFWGNEWNDSDTHRLEEDLGQVLEEIRFRHEAQAAARDAELLRREAKQRQLEAAQGEWDLARDRAITRFKEQFVIDEMSAQANQWNHVSELRRYPEAIRSWAVQVDDERGARAIDWAEQIQKQSDAIDPLQKLVAPPAAIPEPSRDDLKTYMGSRGLFRP